MTEEKHCNFANSLKHLKEARNLSLSEFARALDIPKSTLKSIMEDGQTSLNTALRITEKLGIPIDTLTNGTLSTGQIKILDGLLLQLGWFGRLTPTKQYEACEHVLALIHIIQDSHDPDAD